MIRQFSIVICGVVAVMALGSCFHREEDGVGELQRKVILDRAPLSPPDSRSLEDYALTLPVFEMTDREHIARFMAKYTMKPVTRDLLVAMGDGAQDSFAIRRISSYEAADQRIQLIVYWVAAGPPAETVYELKRIPGGWKRLKTTRTEGEFNRACNDAVAAGARASLKDR